MSLMPVCAQQKQHTFFTQNNVQCSPWFEDVNTSFFCLNSQNSVLSIYSQRVQGSKPPFDCWENRSQTSKQLLTNPQDLVVQLVHVSGRILDVLVTVCYMLDESILHLSGTAFGQGLTSADLYIEFIHQNLLRLCDR